MSVSALIFGTENPGPDVLIIIINGATFSIPGKAQSITSGKCSCWANHPSAFGIFRGLVGAAVRRPSMRISRKTKMAIERLARYALHPRRSCQGCFACCHILAIAEISKPAWHVCEAVENSRCSLHDAGDFYPAECRGYFCAWRQKQGGLRNLESPRLTGLVVDGRQVGSFLMISAKEARPGARFRGNGRAGELAPLISRISRHNLINILLYGGTAEYTLGPLELVKRFVAEGK
jgi:hypothetical protein